MLYRLSYGHRCPAGVEPATQDVDNPAASARAADGVIRSPIRVGHAGMCSRDGVMSFGTATAPAEFESATSARRAPRRSTDNRPLSARTDRSGSGAGARTRARRPAPREGDGNVDDEGLSVNPAYGRADMVEANGSAARPSGGRTPGLESPSSQR